MCTCAHEVGGRRALARVIRLTLLEVIGVPPRVQPLRETIARLLRRLAAAQFRQLELSEEERSESCLPTRIT